MSRPLLTLILAHPDQAVQAAHLARGALFLPEPEPLPEPFMEIILRVETAAGTGVELDGRVLQILPGHGIAVSFDNLPAAKAKLAPLLAEPVVAEEEATFVFWGRMERKPSLRPRVPSATPGPPAPDGESVQSAARSTPGGESGQSASGSTPGGESGQSASGFTPDGESAQSASGSTPGVESGQSAARSAPDEAPPPAPPPLDETSALELELDATAKVEAEIAAMNTNQKMQLAMRGDRLARTLLLKDLNRNLQTFVVQNPRISLDEVRSLAANRQALPDVLNTIAANKDWSNNPNIVLAIIRNPKTAASTAARLMEKVPVAEVRRLAKANDVPRAVTAAARKRLEG